MKYSNLEVGLEVVVKDSAKGYHFGLFKGCDGIIVAHDAESDGDSLGVRVKFNDGVILWGDHKDIKKVKSK